MKKNGFTLLEIIFVIVISAILSLGAFKAMEMLYLRSAKAKAITDMTLRSQIVLDQIGVFLYDRVPNSVIGYKPSDNSCEAITELTTSKPILEWLATMDDNLTNREYDGFVDIGLSDNNSSGDGYWLSAPNIDKTIDDNDKLNLIFAGSFDEGSTRVKACKGAFGWHKNDSNLSFDIKIDDDNNITLTDDNDSQPKYIYEKYYLTQTAYAVARGEDLNESDINGDTDGKCNYNTSKLKDFNNTLFLFYNYKPYRNKETFCGDNSSGGTRKGDVSILATDVTAFEAIYVNETIRINLDMNRSIRGSTAVHISKQKVIF